MAERMCPEMELEVMRLDALDHTIREIGALVKCSKHAVGDVLLRATRLPAASIGAKPISSIGMRSAFRTWAMTRPSEPEPPSNAGSHGPVALVEVLDHPNKMPKPTCCDWRFSDITVRPAPAGPKPRGAAPLRGSRTRSRYPTVLTCQAARASSISALWPQAMFSS